MDNQLTEIKRGEQASVVLENPLFKEAIYKVRQGIIDSMSRSPLGDAETHNRLVIAMQLLNQIEKQLKDVVATGKMSAMQTDNKFKIFR
jgi:hypothetical protein